MNILLESFQQLNTKLQALTDISKHAFLKEAFDETLLMTCSSKNWLFNKL